MALTGFASNRLSASRPTVTSRANNAKRFTNIRANSTNLTNPTIPTTYFVFSTSTPTFPEGSNTTVTVQGYGLATAAQNGPYYWTIESNAGDFGTSSGSFTLTWRGDAYGYSIGSFVLNPTLDGVTEGDETFTIAIRTGSTSGTIISTSLPLTINDTLIPDSYFNFVTLLLSGNGTNNANNSIFVDSSTNNLAITRNGTSTQGAFSPYVSSSSTYFNGSSFFGYSLDSARTTTSLNYALNQDFTVELWAYSTKVPPTYGYMLLNFGTHINAYAAEAALHITHNSASVWIGNANGQDALEYKAFYPASSSLSLNAWNHVAVVRRNNLLTVYINGVGGTAVSAPGAANPNSSRYDLASGHGFWIGGNSANWTNVGLYRGHFRGYMRDFRYVTGTAVYNGNFTPPSAPLLSSGTSSIYANTANVNTTFASANTQVLTLQTNILRNDSNIYLTPSIVDGSIYTRSFSPYSTTNEYNVTTNSGSIYLNGSSTLSVAASTAIQLTGDFTIEFWVYQIADGMVIGSDSGTNSDYFGVASTAIYLAIAYPSQNYPSWNCTIPRSTWNHIAVTRSSNNLKCYLNGLQLALSGGNASESRQYLNSTPLFVGRYGYAVNPNYYTGYISDLRIIKGTVVYTGNFTPPIAPLLTSGTSSIYTSTANVNTTFGSADTSLLLKGTNSGIIDNSMQLNLETVGDAKISTIQSKFGGSSMSFDGNGDYLLIPTTQAKQLSKFLTESFTVECWAYLTTTGTSQTIICAVNNWAAGANYNIRVVTGNFLSVQIGNSITLINGTVPFPLNQWNHIALVRDSATSTKFYLNGSNVASTATNWTADEDCPVTIGAFNTNGSSIGEYWTGYIDDLRITSNIARYTSNFTPPYDLPVR